MWYNSLWFMIIGVLALMANFVTLLILIGGISGEDTDDFPMCVPSFYKEVWQTLRTQLNPIGAGIVMGLWCLFGCVAHLFMWLVVFCFAYPLMLFAFGFIHLFGNKDEEKKKENGREKERKY